MNLAARLEGMCKQYGVEVLISGAMYRRVEGAFLALPLDRVVAAGKSQAADIYELVAERKGAVLALKRRCAAFAEVVAAYSARDFAGALLRAAAYEAAEGPDMAAAKYVARCRVFLESPPPDGLGLYRGAHVQVGDASSGEGGAAASAVESKAEAWSCGAPSWQGSARRAIQGANIRLVFARAAPSARDVYGSSSIINRQLLRVSGQRGFTYLALSPQQ